MNEDRLTVNYSIAPNDQCSDLKIVNDLSPNPPPDGFRLVTVDLNDWYDRGGIASGPAILHVRKVKAPGSRDIEVRSFRLVVK